MNLKEKAFHDFVLEYLFCHISLNGVLYTLLFCCQANSLLITPQYPFHSSFQWLILYYSLCLEHIYLQTLFKWINSTKSLKLKVGIAFFGRLLLYLRPGYVLPDCLEEFCAVISMNFVNLLHLWLHLNDQFSVLS